jgi:uncharacterized membrane protein YfcA
LTEFSAGFLALLFGIGILSGATAAVIGFGIGSLLTPLLLTRFPAPVAIGLVAIPHLIATALRFTRHRHAVDRGVLLRFGIPSAAGGALGGLLYGVLSSDALVTALAVLLILTAIANLTNGFGRWQPTAVAAAGVGFASGVAGGLVGNQGGLRAAGLSAFNLAPRPFLATGTAVALLIDVARTPFYLLRGGAQLLDLWVPIAVATAGCVLGTLLGEHVFFGLSVRAYRRVVGSAVLLLGIWLLAT